jgi:hypothetical protein
MARRFEYAELPGNWVELHEAWTRRELREALNQEGEAFAALLAKKIEACNLETGDGEPITAPAQITREALDEGLRYEVYCWLMSTVTQFVIEVQRLGEATQRRLWRDFAKGMLTAAETETPEAGLPDGALSPFQTL